MIVLDEKDYAEKCLRDGLKTRDLYTSLVIIARYYYHVCKYRKQKIYVLLFDFLKQNYPRYELDEAYWMETIEKIAAHAGKYPLTELRGVGITETEMQTITNIHNRVLERLAFTMLCIAKFWDLKKPNNNGWVNTESKELFQYARISSKAIDREIRIGELHELGLLEFPKKNGNLNCRVTFIHADDTNEALFVDDFRELGYAYLKYRGENFIKCAECGILIRNNKNKTRKYCKNCATYSPIKVKTFTCVDCGNTFLVNASSRKKRCDACAKEERKRINRENQRNWKLKNNTSSF